MQGGCGDELDPTKANYAENVDQTRPGAKSKKCKCEHTHCFRYCAHAERAYQFEHSLIA